MSKNILMKNGVVYWLIKNTKLSDEQISEFSNMHSMQINYLRTNDCVDKPIFCNPITACILTIDEIDRCEKDPNARLNNFDGKITNKKKVVAKSVKKETFISGILWLLAKNKNYSCSAIAKLLGCSVSVVKQVQEVVAKEIFGVIPKHPTSLGLCSQEELEVFLSKNS